MCVYGWLLIRMFDFDYNKITLKIRWYRLHHFYTGIGARNRSHEHQKLQGIDKLGDSFAIVGGNESRPENRLGPTNNSRMAKRVGRTQTTNQRPLQSVFRIHVPDTYKFDLLFPEIVSVFWRLHFQGHQHGSVSVDAFVLSEKRCFAAWFQIVVCVIFLGQIL